MNISNLAHYTLDGTATSSQTLELSLSGIVAHQDTHPWRQILFVPQATLDGFALSATALRANVVIRGSTNIHDLPSGTVITIGAVKVRLTFHCEPCKKITGVVSTKAILHQRGYFGQVIQPGLISWDDKIAVSAERMPAIPYAVADRVRWYLAQQSEPMTASQLLRDLGVPLSYCRALPNIIRNRPDIDPAQIIYASARKKPSR
ncbi:MULTISPECIES: MOSC domain-containing protein [Reinekea]|mgnify:FL=1|uniref:MOSC domain-containing protein n=1 Tax=Reinekea forsetii TaxID=1336806 RepID=A0A2K8KY89_9GAMM|nr:MULTISPECIES: MOSC domain-containing protein [Reinekea]ATX77904.1 hypothetical protein REIFOR_02783 [Reinekea forsetii]MDO7642764.1 MOSC domain-containing protein [Reinekea forsetii]MDO7643894.1 MOSC domain-containing protein [Reinekea forsetii]